MVNGGNKWKTAMLNDTPMSRSRGRKTKSIMFNGTLNPRSVRVARKVKNNSLKAVSKPSGCRKEKQYASFAKTGNKRRFWQKRHTPEDVSKTRKSAMLSANADENNENNGNNGNNDMVYVQWFSKLSEWL